MRLQELFLVEPTENHMNEVRSNLRRQQKDINDQARMIALLVANNNLPPVALAVLIAAVEIFLNADERIDREPEIKQLASSVLRLVTSAKIRMDFEED